ncbi:cell wall-binding repeat-containing protein [Clostridium senegalense]
MKKLFKQKLSILLLFFSMFMFLLPVNASAKVNESRIYGSDRIETAIKISEQCWKSGSDYVFIAYGYDFADALSVTPLAKKYNSPIILSNKNGLTENAIKELQRLKPKKAFILGGEKALSANVEAQIKKCSITETERIYGSTRYETALKVSEKLGTSDTIFISNGLSYADALSVATIAAQKESPILYTEKNNIPSKVTEYIKKANISKAYFVGGTNVIDNTVVTGIKNSERIAGNDRYLTNKEVLSKFINYISYENVYFVRGNDFADALSISPIAGLKKAPIILTNNNLNSDVEKIINSNITSTSKLTIIGGEKVVPSSILDKIDSNFSQTKLSKDNETFGNVETIKEVRGDILVTGNNVTINNVKLNGNLILDPGEKGTVNIKKTTCKNVIVKSGDVNSINLTNVKSDNLVVESKSNVAVKLFEDSTIKNTEVKSNAILKNTKGDFGTLKVTGTKESNYNIELEGKFDKEVLVNCSSNIKCDDVKNIKIDSKESNSKVILKGKVTDVNIINCSNTTLDGTISNVKIENSSQLTIDKNATVKKIEALDKSKITIKNGAKVKLVEKDKNATISGNADKIVENNSNNSSDGSGGNDNSTVEKPKKDEFIFIISENGKTLKTKNLKVENKKSAMTYLKENADAKDNQGFIYEIDGLRNTPMTELTDKEVEKGILGKDWFVYLNGSKTPVGANGVFINSGDKLVFDYRSWDWHDLVDPDYDGKMPLAIAFSGVRRGKVEADKEFTILATCVYQKVYGATIKVDGKEVGKTGRDGFIKTSISEVGKHKITIEKNDGIAEKEIEVTSKSGSGDSDGSEKPKEENFTLVISENGKTLKTKTLKVEDKKSALQYLQEISDAKDNQGFIYEVDGLINMPMNKLTDEEVEKGILGKDWFIYLNGSKTPVGGNGVFVKPGDKLVFDYRSWDWHDLVDPDYDGKMPLTIAFSGVRRGKVEADKEFTILATCVYQKVYGATIKVDGKEVGKTGRDGFVKTSISEVGNHKITIEKNDGIAEKEIEVTSKSGSGGSDGSEKPKEEILFKKLVDDVELTIKKLQNNKITFNLEDKKSSNIPVTIKILDEKENLVYIDQNSLEGGKGEFNTILKNGEFYGSCNIQGILINFKINIK